MAKPRTRQAIREAQEELDVQLRKEDLELLEAYHNDYNPGIFTIDLVFLARRWQGEFTPADDSAGLIWKPFKFIYDPLFFRTILYWLRQNPFGGAR